MTKLHTHKSILWGSPVCDERALGDSHNLGPDGHGVFPVVVFVLPDFAIAAGVDDFVNLFGQLFALSRLGPDVSPVLPLIVRIAGADDLEHILGTMSV
jgi:hypothetical protein